MFFSEIIGQQEIKEKLRKSVKSGHMPHAQIIHGQEGAGSLPLAIAYAQYIACTGAKNGDSCGTCPACQKFSRLIHPDLHFVFPVNTTQRIVKNPVSDDFLAEWRELIISNPYFSENTWYNHIGIENKQGFISKEEADNILRKLNLRSFESDYKFLIIWLPEKMNAAAANHLLKMIEEPPFNTVFLLVSNNPDQVLPTILSRTLPVKLPVLSQSDISGHIQTRFQLSPDKSDEVARLANGNFIKALEIINASSENDFNLEKFIALMRFCWQREFLGINSWVEEMSGMGRESLKNFFQYAQRMVRENYIKNTGEKGLLYMTSEESKYSEKFHPYINSRNISGIYEEINKAGADVERNGYVKLILFDFCLRMVKLIK